MSWCVLVLSASLAAQQPMSAAELTQHVASIRSQLANPGIDLARREALAQDLASTLDRAAQSSPDPETRRNRWGEAISILDRFMRDNSGLVSDRQLRLQTAIFRWAQAQTWAQAAEFEPGNPQHRERAIALFEDALERLRSITTIGESTTLGDNLRFRLAQTLADRAKLEKPGSDARKSFESEAMKLLEKPGAELGLAGFWHVLRADLLLRDGKLDEAGREVDAAAQAKPEPPESEVMAVRVPLLLARKQADAAKAAVNAAKLDDADKSLWRVRILLAELAALPPGDARRKIHGELFQEVRGLRTSQSSESRLALLEVARAGIEPGPDEPPDDWDALAEAFQRSGDPVKAAAADARAAEGAARVGKKTEAAGYRLRAGAFLFQAGQFLPADAELSRVADDPSAGPIRARAGMLRALARGRALSYRQPGASTSAYREALERQIKDFPDDPSTDEARWLLGGLALGEGNPDRARELWASVPTRSTRWLDAQLSIVAVEIEDLDRQLINPDRRKLAESFARADRLLAAAIRQARTEDSSARLMLARARLNLVPDAGRPETARDLCERVNQLPAVPAILYRARLLRLVALVELGRYIEAEREAQTHPDWDLPSERGALFDTVRLLDQGASIANTDLRQRRFGLVLKLMLETVQTIDRKFEPMQIVELKMRLTRALLFIGEDAEARRSLSSWKGTPDTSSDRMLRDLGDTYRRLEIYSLDIDVQRLRIHNNAAGSLPWFDAKYALALAYYHTGQYKDALNVIDATSILHPDLGGGELHEKFIRLRQRIGEKP
ncbi:MAG: hypothetical protein ACYC61_27495 [Isosphaeraceae bacterium]